MFPTLLICSAILSAEIDEPASAADAVAVARLPDYFGEPDPETAALWAMPVAKVNGETIVAGRLLARYDDYLQHVSGRMPSDEYSRIVQEIIQRDLPGAIVGEAFWSRVKSEQSAEMQEGVRRHLEAAWRQETTKLAREFAGHSRRSIRVSLESMREEFIRRGMVMAFLETRFYQLPSDEFREYRRQLLRTAKIETAYEISLEELK